MSVQYGEVPSKAIQDIVLYCLTPARFRRYSSLNLCAPSPAGDAVTRVVAGIGIVSELGGILLVNRFILDHPSPCLANSVRHGARPIF
jgi:hypothetical protein